MNIDVPHNTRAIPDGMEPVVINSGNGGSEKCDDISPLSEATPARRVCGEDDDTPPVMPHQIRRLQRRFCFLASDPILHQLQMICMKLYFGRI